MRAILIIGLVLFGCASDENVEEVPRTLAPKIAYQIPSAALTGGVLKPAEGGKTMPNHFHLAAINAKQLIVRINQMIEAYNEDFVRGSLQKLVREILYTHQLVVCQNDSANFVFRWGPQAYEVKWESISPKMDVRIIWKKSDQVLRVGYRGESFSSDQEESIQFLGHFLSRSQGLIISEMRVNSEDAVAQVMAGAIQSNGEGEFLLYQDSSPCRGDFSNPHFCWRGVLSRESTTYQPYGINSEFPSYGLDLPVADDLTWEPLSTSLRCF